MNRAAAVKQNKGKMQKLFVYDDLSPVVKVVYKTVDELPDNVKNYPPSAQRAFLLSHNAALRRFGNPTVALRAGWRGLQNMMANLRVGARRAGVNLDAYLRKRNTRLKGVLQ